MRMDVPVAAVRWSRRVVTQRYLRLATRAAAMTPQEVWFRALSAPFARRTTAYLDCAWTGAQGARAEQFLDRFGPETRCQLGELLSKRFFFGARQADEFRRTLLVHCPMAVERILALADRLHDQQQDVFGHRVAIVPGKFDWQADPRTGVRRWPAGLVSDRDLVASNVDVKFVWEVNRQQYLTVLGRAFWLTGDGRHADLAARLVTDWIEKNPTGHGVNWSSSLEVAMRSVSWLWSMAYLTAWPGLEDKVVESWLRSLVDHYEHLVKHLSIYTDPTNHLIGEASALWMLTAVFEDLPDRANQQKRAMEVLAREVGRQFAPDGVNREQSTSYLRFTLDFLFQVLALGRRTGAPVDAVIASRARNAVDFVCALIGPDGTVPMIGDSDDARGLPLPELTGWDFRDIASTGAVLFRRAEWKPVAGPIAESTVWQMGCDGVREYEALVNEGSPRPSAVFPDGGYCVFKNEHDRIRTTTIFDVGPLGLSPNAAHGHSDALSLLIGVNGRFLLTDPGTGTYHEDAPTRNWLRGTGAHNTLTVDGLPQADAFDVFKWINPWRSRIIGTFSGEHFEYAVAAHDGYARLKQPVQHYRHLLFVKPFGWIVIDYLDGAGDHSISRHFSVHPAAKVDRESLTAIRVSTCNGEPGLRLEFPDVNNQAELNVFREGGLYSDQYARWVAAPRISIETRVSVPHSLCTFIELERGAAGVMECGRRWQGNEGAVVWQKTRADGDVEMVLFNPRGERVAIPGALDTDVHFLYTTGSSDGRDRRTFEVRMPAGHAGLGSIACTECSGR